MNQSKEALTARRMTEARALLLKDNPFFGRLAMGLRLACAPCGTACTDGERLIMDPEFAAQMKTDKEMQFVILHEVLHCVLEHLKRRNDRDPELFNVACDIVVNSIILGMWGLDSFQVADFEPVHKTPDGQEGRGFNVEEVYKKLLKDSLENSEPRGNKRIDRHDIWKAIADESRLREVWNRQIRSAVKACNATSDMPPVVREIVDSLARRSKVDWRQVLHDFLQFDDYDYNFLPPDRRFSDADYYLPAYNVDPDQGKARNLWICVDTSASISKDQLQTVMAEVQDAMRQAGLAGSISYFDTRVTDPEPCETLEQLKTISPKGGGGTSFYGIFHYLKNHIYPDLPRAIVIFTDGFVSGWPEEEAAMQVPVLWIICKGGNTKIPWGRLVEL